MPVNFKGVPTRAGTSGEVWALVDPVKDEYDWLPGGTGGGGADLTALHKSLLAEKIWSGTAYIWPGDGSPPDANTFTNIAFIDPLGTHDPKTSAGGRNVTNDLWETGTGTGPAGPTGATGATGSAGVGVPTGGTAGQSLTKIDATNYNTQWSTVTGGGGASGLTVTPVKTAAYTAAANEWVQCNVTGGGFAVTLPTAPPDGTRVRIHIVAANTGGTQAVTLTAGAGDTMDAAWTAFEITYKGQWTDTQYEAATKIWRQVQGFNPYLVPLNRLAAAVAPYDMGTNRLVNVANATAATDAMNRQFSDGRYLQPSALHNDLLATMVWSSTQYVWPGGTAPDSNSYTNITFIDPAGTHDPKTSTGGRNVANDLWETGVPSGGGGSGGLLTSSSQTGTTYTFALTDVGTVVEGSNASAQTFTVPLNATVAFQTGTLIEVFQLGAGQITVAAAGGVTLRAPNGAKTKAQYATVELRKRATDEWVVSGDTSV